MGALANRAPTDLVLNAAGQPVLDPSLTSFKEMPLVQVLDIYAELTKRTLLRSPTVPTTATLTLVTKTPLTTEETIQALDSLLSLNGITIIPTGEKFLTVVLTAQQDREGAAFSQMDAKDLPEASQYVTKIVQVKNAKPSEVVPALQPFQKSATAIQAIDATGMLVLRDNAINVKRMMEILEKIDVVLPSDEEFKVIPVNYALAADVAQVLGSFTTAGPSASGGTTSRLGTTGSSTRRTGSTSPFGSSTGIPGVSGVQPGFGTQPGATPGIPGAAQPGTQQAQFQNRLNQIVSNITGGRGGGAPLLGEARIIPYDRSNSLLVLANKSELAMLTRLLREIDVPQQQVLIEALIFETDLTHTRDVNFGVGQKTAAAGANFTGRGGINSIINFSTNTTVLGVGATTGGFAYLAQIGANWATAVQLLESDSKTEVLSRPRIQTSHAEAATIFSGGTTPYVTGSVSGAGFGTQQQISQLKIGINMSVLPLITSDGLVVLDINQTIEGENGTVAIDANLKVPKTIQHTAQSKVAVRDGETIILGGLIRTAMTKSVSGVPVLKDVPGLGALFRSTSENPTRKELMVLIRPTVLKTPELASRAAESELHRSPSRR
jgi:general secretion pathway protein D